MIKKWIFKNIAFFLVLPILLYISDLINSNIPIVIAGVWSIVTVCWNINQYVKFVEKENEKSESLDEKS